MKTTRIAQVAEARTPPHETADTGAVQLGALSPSFPAVRLPQGDTKDRGRVQMGALSPSFPPVR